MSPPQVRVHRDKAALAEATADLLVTAVVAAQNARGSASLVLTGGGIGTAVLAVLATAPGRSAIDWRRLDLWWGDERFLPAGHPDRNHTQARAALLDLVRLEPSRVHPMPASDGADGPDPEAAAASYAAELAALAEPGSHPRVPTFDVLLLGVGPDGHVASLFPEQAALHEAARTVVGVRGSPKPPPVRITMTLPAIQSAAQVWLLAAGAEKSTAVRLALSGAGAVQVPAAGARGRARTLVLIDEAAAQALPPGLDRIASQ